MAALLAAVGAESLKPPAMSATVGEAVHHYVATRRWSAGTQKHSRYTLEQFAEVVGVDTPVGDIDHSACERWWATRQHLAASSARTRRSTVSNFLRWCRHVGLLERDPLAGIPIPREPRRNPVVLSAEQLAHLERSLPDDRAAAIVSLMSELGFRASDVANLQVGDVDFAQRLVLVRGKGGHEDLLPLPTVCATALKRYLRRHPTPAGPLFRTYQSQPGPMSAQCVSELVGVWLADAGLKSSRYDGVGAHCLRRTCATRLLAEGHQITSVQSVLRHQSIQTTSRYLRRVDVESLRSVVERGGV